jgi:tRNA nucleotidyltransferase (CCA-adding enzyme)
MTNFIPELDLDLFGKMEKYFPYKLLQRIKEIGLLADKNGVNVYLVGGSVRDMMLGLVNSDLDMVVEPRDKESRGPEAIIFARKLSQSFRGKVVEYKKYGTATFFSEYKIDLATARSEIYKEPAAMPLVSFGCLRDDLFRRDFTINAIAVSVNENSFGSLVDVCEGRKDLANKSIRVFHDMSFIEDPTRIFRAVRFEQRLSFQIEDHTESLIREAVCRNMLGKLENRRINIEIARIMEEDLSGRMIFRMKELCGINVGFPETG